MAPGSPGGAALGLSEPGSAAGAGIAQGFVARPARAVVHGHCSLILDAGGSVRFGVSRRRWRREIIPGR